MCTQFPHIYIYIYIYHGLCASARGRKIERERDRERQRDRQRERQRERESGNTMPFHEVPSAIAKYPEQTGNPEQWFFKELLKFCF